MLSEPETVKLAPSHFYGGVFQGHPVARRHLRVEEFLCVIFTLLLAHAVAGARNRKARRVKGLKHFGAGVHGAGEVNGAHRDEKKRDEHQREHQGDVAAFLAKQICDAADCGPRYRFLQLSMFAHG